MFSSFFTMSEQEHRQWTPYKHCETNYCKQRMRLVLDL
jgi:hypothetical protein